MFEDSDCEGVIDEMLTTENEDKESYKAFNLNIMEISDIETSEDEDHEERIRRIEQLAAGMALLKVSTVLSSDCNPIQCNSYYQSFAWKDVKSSQRSELNMDIDTLSERSEEEADTEAERRAPRQRRVSGRKRSESRERSVAKIRSVKMWTYFL